MSFSFEVVVEFPSPPRSRVDWHVIGRMNELITFGPKNEESKDTWIFKWLIFPLLSRQAAGITFTVPLLWIRP